MTARVLVEIAASLGRFEADFAKASKVTEENSKKMQHSVDEATKKAQEYGKAIIGAFGVSLGIEGAIRAFEALKDKTIEAERSLNQFHAVLQATGQSVGLTTSQLDALGKSIADSSIFDDDQVRAAQTALLRFRDIQSDVFKDTLRLAPDLATVLGTSLPSAASLLGRALTDPEHGMRALREAGVFLSTQQKDLAARLIESGDKAGAQRIIIDALRGSIAGAGEADTKGLLGATTKLSKAWEELEKTTGKKLFADNQTSISLLAKAFEGLAHQVEHTDFNLAHLLARAANPIASTAFDIVKAAVERFGPKKPNFPSADTSLPDATLAEQQAADDARRAQRQKQLDDEFYNEQQAFLKRRAAGSAAFHLAEIQSQRAYLQSIESQLDFSFSRQDLTVKEFYDTKRELVVRAQREEEAYIGKQIEDTEKLLDKNNTSVTRDERFAAIAKLKALNDQADKSRYDMREKLADLDRKEITSVEKLGDEYDSLHARVLALQGDLTGSAQIEFNIANRDKRRGIAAGLSSSDPSARARASLSQADLAFDESSTLKQSRMTMATRDFGLSLDAVELKQRRIDLQLQQSTISELDALARKSQANREALPELAREIEAAQRVADSYEKGSLQARIAQGEVEKLRFKMEELAASSDLVAQKFRGIFESGFSNAFTSFLDGTRSAKDAFKDFTKSVTHDINSMVSKQLANAIFGGQGVLGGVGGLFGNLFASGAAATNPFSGFLASLSANQPGGFASVDTSAFLGFASGGDPPVGLPSWVGEHGPELIVPKHPTTVIPHNVVSMAASRAARGSYAGPQIIQNINVMPGVTRQSALQAQGDLSRGLMQAQRNL